MESLTPADELQVEFNLRLESFVAVFATVQETTNMMCQTVGNNDHCYTCATICGASCLRATKIVEGKNSSKGFSRGIR